MVTTTQESLWELHARGWTAVIPINKGFRRANQEAIMGAGVAGQAARRWPELTKLLGQACVVWSKGDTYEGYYHLYARQAWGLVMLATKSLDTEYPWLSWKRPSSIEQVEASLRELRLWSERGRHQVVLPLLGAGLGRLDPARVLERLREVLEPSETNFLVSTYGRL